MARRLRPIILDVDLQPATYLGRTGVDDMPREPTRDDVVWQTLQHTRSKHAPGGYESDVAGEHHPARATLPLDEAGLVVTDVDFDTDLNGHRVASSPTLHADSLRQWFAIELHEASSAGSSVTYRLNDGTTDLYWNGAWSPAVDDDADWSTKAQVQANFETFPAGGRELTVRARLSSSNPGSRPSWLGFSVAYGIRDIADEEDALIRTLQRHLTAELRPTAVARMTVPTGGGAGPFRIGAEQGFDVVEVLAVFDLTADPGESTPLPGTLTPGTQPDKADGTVATWTPDAPIADGATLHVEFAYRPDVVVSRHRDVVELPRLPAVLFIPEGAPSQLRSGIDNVVRNLTVDPPTGVSLPAPARFDQPLTVSVIAEQGSDVRRIMQDLRALLGGCGHLELLSEESGRFVDVREVVPLRTGSGRLLQGVQEATGTWLLGYASSSAVELAAVHLTRTGGVIAGTG